VYQCAVKLEDYQQVDPHANGERVEESSYEQTNLPFELKIFSDDTFTNEHVIEDIRDIGVLSTAEQKVYVQGRVNVDNKFLHLSYCLVKVYDEDESGKQTNTQDFKFIDNGCLVSDPFINRNFFMMPARFQFSDTESETIDRDQFQVDLWDTSINEDTLQKTYHFECRLLACDSLNNGGEEYCHVSDTCSSRYSNLKDIIFGSRRRRRDISTELDAVVSADIVFNRRQRSPIILEDSSGTVTFSTSAVLILTVLFLY